MADCRYCVGMATLHLPGHRVELFCEAGLEECTDSAYLDYIMKEYDSKPCPNFGTVWSLRRYVHLHHFRHHKESGTTCDMFEAFKGRAGSDWEEVLSRAA